MDLANLVTFNIALLVALASPGPALLYSMTSTLRGGIGNGVKAGLGLAIMAGVWTLMALMGLHGIFKLFPWAYLILKTVGALYLIYIAWRTWRSAHEALSEVDGSETQAFRGGLLINLANPKSVLFAGAVLVVIFPHELNAFEKAFIVANHILIEMIAYTGFAFLLSRNAVSRQYLKAKPILDRAFAVVLGLLGGRLLLDR